MSSRKRPLGELTNPPSTTQTPRRYAPSTPHAIRALQQRSGAKTRSARPRRFIADADTVNPASARGVLRRLAKITAPATRSQRTPSTAGGKENLRPPGDEHEDDGSERKKPRMTFDIDESIEESMEEVPPTYVEDDDSELPPAPTPSVLPEDGDQPTITFRSIDFARQEDGRRASRMSVPAEVEDDDATIMTERGRRAVTEEATGRLSRYSFGSIRMSDFGSELEVQRDSNGKARLSEAQSAFERKSLGNTMLLDATEDLSVLVQPSPTVPTLVEDDLVPVIDDDNFQLELPDEDGVAAVSSQQRPTLSHPEEAWEDVHEPPAEDEPMHLSPKSKRRLTEMQLASAKHENGKRRRKRVKMTKHGSLVPSLPTSLIKKIATEVQIRNGRRKPALGPDHTKALEQATEWFLEQIGEDLATYSSHGRRKRRIDNEDVLLLMQRQRMAQDHGELKKLAKEWLPKDVRKSLDLPDE